MLKKTLHITLLAITLAAPVASVSWAADPAPAAAASSALKPDPRYTYQTPRLDRAKVDALLAHPEHVVILDVRRPDELSKYGGLPAYLSIQSDDVEKELAYIPKDRQIITVSNRAHRAGAVGDALSKHGFKVAGAFGVLDYEEQGGTLTKIAPPPPKPADAAKPAEPAKQ